MALDNRPSSKYFIAGVHGFKGSGFQGYILSLFILVCLDERSISQVHGKPNHDPIAEDRVCVRRTGRHCKTTYGAKCEWRQMMEDRWLSVDDIAAYLGIKRDTVYRWISERNMPGHKIGRLWKFQKKEVDEWMRSGGGTEKRKDGAKE